MSARPLLWTLPLQALNICLHPQHTIQRLVGDLMVPTDDVSLARFLKINFLPPPTHNEVCDYFKSKNFIKSVRSNTWDATAPVALWIYFDVYHKEVNFYDHYFDSFRTKRPLRCNSFAKASNLMLFAKPCSTL